MTAPKQSSHFNENANIPDDIYKTHKRVHLYIDICYINKLAFMVTISKNINFISINYIKNKSKKEIIKCISNIINIYEARGFEVTDIYGDNGFNIKDLHIVVLSTPYIYVPRTSTFQKWNEPFGQSRKEQEQCATPYHTVDTPAL